LNVSHAANRLGQAASSRVVAATTTESKTAIARQSERRNVRPEPCTPKLAEVLSPPITSWLEGWLADGVPVYRRHCALLI
jgi:hypothetical protein